MNPGPRRPFGFAFWIGVAREIPAGLFGLAGLAAWLFLFSMIEG
jgi:hypothetical protein